MFLLTEKIYQVSCAASESDPPPHCWLFSGLQEQHDKIHDLAVIWFRSMTEDIRAGILSHYGDMPALEAEYWRLQSGPAWCWWVLAILPLDHQAQVRHRSQRVLFYKNISFSATNPESGTLNQEAGGHWEDSWIHEETRMFLNCPGGIY